MEYKNLINYFSSNNWRIISYPDYESFVLVDEPNEYVAFLNKSLFQNLLKLYNESTLLHQDSLKEIVVYAKNIKSI